MTETMANGYSSEGTQRKLFNEYQHDKVYDGFQKIVYVLVLWTKVASALEGSIRNVFFSSNMPLLTTYLNS